MANSPDLFVVCKNCRAEVSPYITECPYCGHRLRKRAPKLDKGAVPRAPKRRRPQAPSLGRLRPGEIPGIRADGRPLATLLIVLVSVFVTLAFLISDSAARNLVFVEGDRGRLVAVPDDDARLPGGTSAGRATSS